MTRLSQLTALNVIAAGQNSSLLSNSIEKEITFVATTTGAIDTHDLFTVTGVVAMNVFAVCSTNLAGASSTIEIGTAKSTAGLIAQTTGTDLDANEIWHNASPSSSIEAITIIANKVVAQDVAYKIATAALSAGVIKIYCKWSPISADGNVILA